MKNRKIALPNDCSPFTGVSRSGEEDCDHDYYYLKDDDVRRHWKCSKCNMERSYEFFQ
jgi:hypothetical protein